MARKNYSEEFRRQAVDLYESTPGATVRGIGPYPRILDTGCDYAAGRSVAV